MSVFQRCTGGLSSFARSGTKLLHGLSYSLPDNIGVFHRNKCFVRGFSAVRNSDTVEVDISRLEGENHGRCIVFELYLTSARAADL